jgi:5-hydroxyisourate hydrolase-like protein (transthyretin family)
MKSYGLGQVHGSLAVHVIDLAKGLPACGMRVDLYMIESSGAEHLLRSGAADRSGPYYNVRETAYSDRTLRAAILLWRLFQNRVIEFPR